MKMSEEDMTRANLTKRTQVRLVEVQGAWHLLLELGMGDCAHQILSKGYDSIEDIQNMDESDLEQCGVQKPGHKRRFKRNVGQLYAEHRLDAHSVGKSTPPEGAAVV